MLSITVCAEKLVIGKQKVRGREQLSRGADVQVYRERVKAFCMNSFLFWKVRMGKSYILSSRVISFGRGSRRIVAYLSFSSQMPSLFFTSMSFCISLATIRVPRTRTRPLRIRKEEI